MPRDSIDVRLNVDAVPWRTVNEVRRRMAKFNKRERPYENLTNGELNDVLAAKLKRGREPMPAWYQQVYTSSATSTTGNVVYGTSTTTPLYGLDVSYEWDNGTPVAKVKLGEKGPEDDRAWLKRRVDEICWRPQ